MESSRQGYWTVDWEWNRAERFSLTDIEAKSYQARMNPNNPGKIYGVHGDALVVASEKGIRLEAPDRHEFWAFAQRIQVENVGSDGESLWILELEGRLSKLALIDGHASSIASVDLGDVGVGLAVDGRGVAVLTNRVLGPPTLLRLYDLELNLLAEHPFDASLFAPQVVLGPNRVAVGYKQSWEFFPRP